MSHGGKRTGAGRPKDKAKLAPHDEALRAHIADHPDATLAEIKSWLASDRQVEVSVGCLWNRLRRLNLPLKKSPSAPPSRIAPMSQPRARFGVASKPS